jgi:hypothetical protein
VSRLGTLSEIDKLSATLGLDRPELAFLAEIPPQDLRSLRVSIYERLFDQDRVVFERLAVGAIRLPPRLATKLAVALGPLITARVALEVPQRKALEIANRVPIEFFADAAAYLDPRRLRDMIAQLDPDRLTAVGLELIARGDFMTISRFIDFVTDEQVQATIAAIDDEASILRIAFYMGSKNRMDHLFRSLPEARLRRMVVRVEERGEELLPAFLSVLIHVSYTLKRELGDIIADQDEPVLTGYIRATQDSELWPDVLPFVATMSPVSTRKVVNLPILAEPEVQAAIIETADCHDQWGLVLPMIRTMNGSNRDAVASIIAGMGPDTLARAADAALLGEHWDTLLDLATRMPDSAQEVLGTLIARMLEPFDPDLLARIAAQAAALGMDHLTSESRSGVSASSA